MKDDGNFKRYSFTYQHDGASWGFRLMAADPEDAKRRLASIAAAEFGGEVIAEIRAAVPPCDVLAELRAIREHAAAAAAQLGRWADEPVSSKERP